MLMTPSRGERELENHSRCNHTKANPTPSSRATEDRRTHCVHADARVEVMEILIRHAHAFVRERRSVTRVENALSPHATAKCVRTTSGIHLLSDISGFHAGDAVNNSAGTGLTIRRCSARSRPCRNGSRAHGVRSCWRGGWAASSVEGLFVAERGADKQCPGRSLADGAEPAFDVQDDAQPEGHLRASFRTDEGGTFSLKSILPVAIRFPTTGRGQLLDDGRHPFRPATRSFHDQCPGYRTDHASLFIGDAYLDTSVFGSKPSLIVTRSAMARTGSSITSASSRWQG